MTTRHWIVICPERYARRGIWHVWYRDKCVAIGWPPSKYHPEGDTDVSGWRWARDCMRKMQPGELVIPYLQQWRVGPVGVIKKVHLADEDWNPTVAKGDYTQNPLEAELGRRIDVEWRSEGMPPGGMGALIPPEKRLRRPDALSTIEELKPDRFDELVKILGDPQNWTKIGGSPEEVVEILPADPPELSLLEETLKQVLIRNLGLIEPGLSPHPDYPGVAEVMTDVGRIDLFCIDKDKNFVVIELKVGPASDHAVGQITRYMGWVKQNLHEGRGLRGILVCADFPAGTLAARAMIPGLSLMRYKLSCNLEQVP